jgi:hypothetical protein
MKNVNLNQKSENSYGGLFLFDKACTHLSIYLEPLTVDYLQCQRKQDFLETLRNFLQKYVYAL